MHEKMYNQLALLIKGSLEGISNEIIFHTPQSRKTSTVGFTVSYGFAPNVPQLPPTSFYYYGDNSDHYRVRTQTKQVKSIFHSSNTSARRRS